MPMSAGLRLPVDRYVSYQALKRNGFRFQPTLGVVPGRFAFPALRRYMSFEVPGYVFISVVQGVTTSTNPETVMQWQVLVDPPTNQTGLGTGKEAVYPFDPAAAPLTFVLWESAKTAPAEIEDGFGR